MDLTDAGLNRIEQYADKKRLPDVLLLVQILKEIRELKASMDVLQNTNNGSNNSAGSADDRKNKNS